MNILKDKIKNEGIVIEPGILKVDNFLNHQIDVALFYEIGKEFAKHFENRNITKILTVEASGIAIACFVSYALNMQPVVYAKKDNSSIINTDAYYSDVHSYTKNTTCSIRIDKSFINEDDNVLIVDDFLANGQACLGLIDIIEQANAKVVGIGIVIEKGFQPGRKILEEKGYDVFSLAIIKEFVEGKVIFE